MTTPVTPRRFQHLDRILTRAGPFVDPDSFNPGETTQKFLREDCKVLVIGETRERVANVISRLELICYLLQVLVDLDARSWPTSLYSASVIFTLLTWTRLTSQISIVNSCSGADSAQLGTADARPAQADVTDSVTQAKGRRKT